MSDLDRVYCYPPEFNVLKNLYGLRTATDLKKAETEAVADRLMQPIPNGDFDLGHLRAIHRHLFQDVYEWSGETRKTPLSKGGTQFMPPDRIEQAMHFTHGEVTKADYFRGSSPEEFGKGVAEIIADVNTIHPFREGNGRTQFQFLKQLGAQAGHHIDLSRVRRDDWLLASKMAVGRELELMTSEITRSIVIEREHEKTKETSLLQDTEFDTDISTDNDQSNDQYRDR